jgi:hypothetical protein
MSSCTRGSGFHLRRGPAGRLAVYERAVMRRAAAVRSEARSTPTRRLAKNGMAYVPSFPSGLLPRVVSSAIAYFGFPAPSRLPRFACVRRIRLESFVASSENAAIGLL